jgi:hypothetical protein
MEPKTGDVCSSCGGTVRVEHVDDTSIDDDVEHRRPRLVCDCPDGQPQLAES